MKLSSGHPLTKLSSTDGESPKVAIISNKSGYSATLIGGRKIAGWKIPANLQVNNEAQAENIKVSIDFFKYAQNLRGVFGFGKMVEVGMTLGANTKACMDSIEFENIFSRISFRCFLMQKTQRVNA